MNAPFAWLEAFGPCLRRPKTRWRRRRNPSQVRIIPASRHAFAPSVEQHYRHRNVAHRQGGRDGTHARHIPRTRDAAPPLARLARRQSLAAVPRRGLHLHAIHAHCLSTSSGETEGRKSSDPTRLRAWTRNHRLAVRTPLTSPRALRERRRRPARRTGRPRRRSLPGAAGRPPDALSPRTMLRRGAD
jgi:hypothetical protein